MPRASAGRSGPQQAGRRRPRWRPPVAPTWCDVPSALHPERVGLGQLAGLPLAGALERLDGGRLIEVDDRVELRAHARVEVVRDPLGLRAVDDADRTLQAPAVQLARVDDEPARTPLVEQLL